MKEIIYIGLIDDDYYLIYYEENKKNVFKIYSKKLDIDNYSMDTIPVKLAEVNGKITSTPIEEYYYGNEYYSSGRLKKFHAHTSKSSKNQLLVTYKKSGSNGPKSKEPFIYGFLTISNESKKDWHSEYTFSEKGIQTHINKIQFIDLSEIRLICSTNDDSNILSNYLCYYDINGSGINKIEITEDTHQFFKKDFINVSFSSKNDKIFGFYGGDKDKPINKGLFISKVGYNKKNSEKLDFYSLLKNQNTSDSLLRWYPNNELTDLMVNHITIDSNNSTVFIREERFKINKTRKSSKKYSTKQFVSWNFYGEIIALKISSDDSLLWARKIPKLQIASSNNKYVLNLKPDKLSYLYNYKNNKHYFIYLDHIDNNTAIFEQSTPKPYHLGAYAVLRLITIDDDTGKVYTRTLLNTQTFGSGLYQLSPNRMILTKNNELILEAYTKQRKDVLLKISIHE